MPNSSQSSFGDTVHARFPCSKLKLDNLFLHWLSLQETQKLVRALFHLRSNRTPERLQISTCEYVNADHLPCFLHVEQPPIHVQDLRGCCLTTHAGTVRRAACAASIAIR